jgi:Uncharacterised protein family (UPF0158)
VTDTPAGVDTLYRRMLLARSGEDRLLMGFSMYSTARSFVVASILEREPQASPERIREAVFLRFYGRDFDDATREKILARLAGERPPRRRVSIDWADLEMALTANADEWTCYLDVRTGEIQMVPVDRFGEDADGRSEEEIDAGLKAGHLIHVEPFGSSVEYGWMVDFAASVDEARLRDRLEVALDGRGAFRRFKNVLLNHPAERERWFAFRGERFRAAARAWLAEQGIEPTTPPPGRRDQE